MTNWNENLARFFSSRMTDNALRIAIIAVAFIAIALALTLPDTWELAVVLAYLVLP